MTGVHRRDDVQKIVFKKSVKLVRITIRSKVVISTQGLCTEGLSLG